jgi:hypothetical protein
MATKPNDLVAGLLSLSRICLFAGASPKLIDGDTGRYGTYYGNITEQYRSIAPLLAEACEFLSNQPEVYVKPGGSIERLAVLNQAVICIRETISDLIFPHMNAKPLPKSTAAVAVLQETRSVIESLLLVFRS